jgi:hypothetical protein
MSIFRPRPERAPRLGPNDDPTCPLCGETGVTFVRRDGSLVCIECARTRMSVVADLEEPDER